MNWRVGRTWERMGLNCDSLLKSSELKYGWYESNKAKVSLPPSPLLSLATTLAFFETVT